MLLIISLLTDTVGTASERSVFSGAAAKAYPDWSPAFEDTVFSLGPTSHNSDGL